MIKKDTFVLYKNSLALVKEIDAEKFLVEWQVCPPSPTGKKAQYAQQKVREKDVIAFMNDNFCAAVQNKEKISLEISNEKARNEDLKKSFESKIIESWELLSGEDDNSATKSSFQEIIELSLSSIDVNEIWAFYKALCDLPYFKEITNPQDTDGTIYFQAQTQNQIDEQLKKENEKENAARLQDEFIARLKQKKIDPVGDAQYMQEIEAFALGKTDKSRYMALAGFSQKIEKAHKLLLDTGFWPVTKNPYPARYGLSMQSAKIDVPSPPQEERIEIKDYAYAIDNEISNDPDDAVSFDGEYVWVHIADPASAIEPDSNIDIDARKRGTTLYMPDGISRMISEDALSEYALGLQELSNALSFKLKLDENANIIETDVLKTKIRVKRLTYEQAETMQESTELKSLFEIAKKYREKRLSNGAIELKLPQVSVWTEKNEDSSVTVHIEEEKELNSKDMVKEMMLMAGEGASKFAFKNNIPFPYISTEEIEVPKKIEDGLAGQYQLRRCMRARRVSITPSMHCSLGIA
ncbi:MAG: RNB domain-containing ribonuclease, partial [Treponemataceae bacterium]|nr:RNB domain-containing ribonuclease [Treponemataceae bacterium]